MAGGPFTPVQVDVSTDEARRALERLAERSDDIAANVLHREAMEILRASQLLVPVDKGDLKNSGRVTNPVVSKGAVTVRVQYGRRGIAYAVAVHEIPPPGGSVGGRTARHAAPTGYKFLERPANTRAAGMEARLAQALGRELERHAP